MTLFDWLRGEIAIIASYTDPQVQLLVDDAGSYAMGAPFPYDNTTLATDVPGKERLIMVLYIQWYFNCVLCGSAGGSSIINADKKTIRDADNTITIESSSSSGTSTGSSCNCEDLKKFLDDCITEYYGATPVSANTFGMAQIGSCVKP